ncbi:MAG: penicillin-binding protein 2 [Thermoleophilia bacterium]|nr:penicillin-binding protein 2 [Thermoleophilia bacterium]GIK77152.1 MAG: penicillin-binding protein 2 [Actinomycetes bacterium]
MFRHDENAAPTHAQFAMRVAVIGGIAVVAFAAIVFRLWFLEVLSGETYLKEANANRVREVKIPAPRGDILDRAGRVLVDNKTVLSLQVEPSQLPRMTEPRNRELRKVARVAGMSYARVKDEMTSQMAASLGMEPARFERKVRNGRIEPPSVPVTLKQDIPFDRVAYLRERQDEFPGVSATQQYVRDYPRGTLGAHLFGYVAEIGPDQLEEPAYDGLEPGDRIGATGLELQYDPILRGRNGAIRVQVDAQGQPRGRELSRIEPEPGDNLKLTLDAKVQAAGESALAATGLPGAFVAMDVDDGSILGMGSAPGFDPSIFTPPVEQGHVQALTDADEDPLLDRATQSAYPTGSTFKAVTGSAALEAGLVTPEHTFSDSGSFEWAGREWINAGEAANGIVDMVSALRVSSDVFFYDIGIMADDAYEQSGEEVIQDWAKQLGFGSPTGIDLPAEGAGLVPTPEWRDKLFEQAGAPGSCGGRARLFEPGCYETDRPWSVGDMMNLAVGQGDLQATPLQLATSYAAIANGGAVVRPHLGMEAEDPSGAQTQAFEPAPRRQVDLDETTRTTIMEGLRQAAMEPGGTSYPTFGGYPVEIAGKTGTAEKTDQEDQSWYAAVAPADDPEYVVAVTVERGGWGASTAAPAACEILNALFAVNDGCVAGTSQTL